MAQSKKQPNKGGRPKFTIDDKVLHQIEVLAGHGFTLAKIADFLGCSERTFRQRRSDDEVVSAALKKGLAISEAKIANALFRLAMSGNLGAIVWWEKTRAGRRENADPSKESQGGTMDQLLDAINRSYEVIKRRREDE